MCLLFIFVYQAVSQASRVKKEMSEMSGLKPVLCALHKVYTVVFLLPRLQGGRVSSTQDAGTGYLLSTLLDNLVISGRKTNPIFRHPVEEELSEELD